jgi:putative iron-regulated protein
MKNNSFPRIFVAIGLSAGLFLGCKEEPPVDPGITNAELQQEILDDFALKVALPLYRDMETRMGSLYNACTALSATTDDSHLTAARDAWRSVRGVWEQSEAFLFGPVSTDNIDPSTDTWPVDFNALDSLLQTSVAFTQNYLNGLGDELKGYHPAEYLLWGADGNKVAGDFTAREMDYLIALSADLQLKATSLRTSWDSGSSTYYCAQVQGAGNSTSVYPSERAAFEEIVNAMIGICDEVANGKINEPFSLQDPSLEESPFSQNSLVDFKNNIQGVKNVYFGKYSSDGYGINDYLVKNQNSLHNTIAAQLEQALTAFDGITVPFGEAIVTQPAQVQGLMDRINTLKTTLEEQLLPFIQTKIEG